MKEGCFMNAVDELKENFKKNLKKRNVEIRKSNAAGERIRYILREKSNKIKAGLSYNWNNSCTLNLSIAEGEMLDQEIMKEVFLFFEQYAKKSGAIFIIANGPFIDLSSFGYVKISKEWTKSLNKDEDFGVDTAKELTGVLEKIKKKRKTLYFEFVGYGPLFLNLTETNFHEKYRVEKINETYCFYNEEDFLKKVKKEELEGFLTDVLKRKEGPGKLESVFKKKYHHFENYCEQKLEIWYKDDIDYLFELLERKYTLEEIEKFALDNLEKKEKKMIAFRLRNHSLFYFKILNTYFVLGLGKNFMTDEQKKAKMDFEEKVLQISLGKEKQDLLDSL